MPRFLFCVLLCLSGLSHASGEYLAYEEWQALAAQLEKEKVYAPGELATLFADVSRNEGVLRAIARPAEATLEWKDYRPNFVNPDRVQRGLEFWATHAEALTRAEQRYGVPAAMIVAIIGVETKYGANKGRNRVIDALATLGLDYPPRAPFFRKELMEFLRLCKETGLDPLSTYGSYAGALGFPQFMPSNWRTLAVDFDDDGKIDLINNPVDAIGSVGHYFQHHGWQSGAPVVIRARIVSQDYDRIIQKDLNTNSSLGEIAKAGLIPRVAGIYSASSPASALRLQGENGGEYWLAFPNFYVITRYNRSILYAMAAFQLSQELQAARTAQLSAASQP